MSGLKNQRFSAILFDLDGTIVDTEPLAAQVLKDIFAEMGQNLTDQDTQIVVGRTGKLAIQMTLNRFPHINKSVEEVLKSFESRYKIAIETLPVSEIVGARSAVKAFAHSYKLGLVSGSCRADILFFLKKLGIFECFQVILGAEDYPNSKPAPDGYLLAMQILGVTPDKTLIFEDSKAGIASAKAAGATVVAIQGPATNLEDQGLADKSLQDFKGVSAEFPLGLTN